MIISFVSYRRSQIVHVLKRQVILKLRLEVLMALTVNIQSSWI
jgi:hypothetical protein